MLLQTKEEESEDQEEGKGKEKEIVFKSGGDWGKKNTA